MNQEEKKETKDRILDQARLLFSQLGFKGTSVRLIAEKSNVNIAAINYHFGSKESLYWSVIDEAYNWLENGIKSITENAEDIQGLTKDIFRFMRSEGHYVLSTMKTFLSDAVPAPADDHPYMRKLEKEELSPPGGDHIANFLHEQFPKAPKEAISWAVLCLFSSLFHFSTMTCTNHFENMKSCKTPIEDIEQALMVMSQALVNHMQSNQQWK